MAIEVRELEKSFGNFQALSGLSFTVPKGKITGFLGPNGAGKTTTLKLLLGLLKKDRGTIKLLGTEIERPLPGALKRKIGYLSEEPIFPEQLTAWEVLTLVGENYGLQDTARARNLLAQFQLTQAADRKVAGYSRGMKQKLGLVVALLPEPELLILDEPVSALDPVARQQVLELLATLAGKTTIFFSSHILADVERICQQVIIINKGRKLVEGELAKLLAGYRQTCYALRTGDWQLAKSLLEASETVAGIQQEGERLLVTVKAGELGRFRTKTIQELLHAGLELYEFAPAKEELERIFLRILKEGEHDELGMETGMA